MCTKCYWTYNINGASRIYDETNDLGFKLTKYLNHSLHNIVTRYMMCKAVKVLFFGMTLSEEFL